MRVLSPTFAILMAALALSLAGCADPVLGRAAFIGASATVGYGAETEGPDGALPVDLAVVYEATTRSRVRNSIRLGDGAFYTRPDEAAREQVDALLNERPTIVVAIDWLFWSVYAPLRAERTHGDRVDEVAADGGVAERVARVEAALAELSRLDRRGVPIVLGSVPRLDVDAERGVAAARTAGHRSRIGADGFAAIDRVVREWAEARPWVVVVPLESIFTDAQSESAIGALVQPDGLHPTAEGLLLLTQRAFAALAAAEIVAPGAWHNDLDTVRAGLATRSRRALASGRAGWLEVAAAERAYRAALDAIDEGDCGRAAAEAERLLSLARRFDRDPTGFGLGSAIAGMVAQSLLESCPEHAIVVRRAAESLALDARQARPNPFRLELWIELASMLDRDAEILEQMAALADTLEIEEVAVGGAYARAFRDTVRSYRIMGSGATREDAIARRAHVARAYGGPDRLHAVGRAAVEATAVAARDPRLAALHERIAARPDGAPRLEPFPPRSAELMALSSAVSTITQVSTIRRDLIAAGAPQLAAELGVELEDRVGIGVVALLAARDMTSLTDGLLPEWSVRMMGQVDTEVAVANRLGADPDPRLEWGVRAQAAFPVALRPRIAVADDSMASVGIGDLLPPGSEIDDSDAASIGLFTSVDGETVVVRFGGDSISHGLFDPDGHDADAEFRTGRSAVARSTAWRAIAMQAEVDDLDALEALIWRAALAEGIDAAWPMPFVVEIDATAVEARVLDRPVTTASGRVRVVGIFAPAVVGQLVRPGRAAHAHVIWTSDDGTPETGELTGIAGAVVGLRLPG